MQIRSLFPLVSLCMFFSLSCPILFSLVPNATQSQKSGNKKLANLTHTCHSRRLCSNLRTHQCHCKGPFGGGYILWSHKQICPEQVLESFEFFSLLELPLQTLFEDMSGLSHFLADTKQYPAFVGHKPGRNNTQRHKLDIQLIMIMNRTLYIAAR